MTISYVDTSTQVGNGNTTTLTVGLPSGVTTGDLLMIVCRYTGAADTLSAPGYTQRFNDSPLSPYSYWVAYKFHSGTESNPAITRLVTGGMSAVVVAFRGVDNVTPFASAGVQRAGGSATATDTAVSITATSAPGMVLNWADPYTLNAITLDSGNENGFTLAYSNSATYGAFTFSDAMAYRRITATGSKTGTTFRQAGTPVSWDTKAEILNEAGHSGGDFIIQAPPTTILLTPLANYGNTSAPGGSGLYGSVIVRAFGTPHLGTTTAPPGQRRVILISTPTVDFVEVHDIPPTPPVPSETISLLASSHVVTSRIEYKRWYEPDANYRPLQDAPQLIIADGSVTNTRTSMIRRTATVRIGGWDGVPQSDFGGPISPANRYRIWRGVQGPNGEKTEWLLGTFLITDVASRMSAQGPEVTLDLADEMKQVDLDPLPSSLGVSAAVAIKNVIRWLLTDLTGWNVSRAAGDVEYAEYDDTGAIVTTTVTPTFIDPRDGTTSLKNIPTWTGVGPYAVDDPNPYLGADSQLGLSRTDVLQSLADGAGLTVYLDEYGQVKVEKNPILIDLATWTADELAAGNYLAWTFDGGLGGTLTERGPSWSIDDFANETDITSGDFSSHNRLTGGALSAAELGMKLRYTEDVSDQTFGDDLVKLRRYAKRVTREHLGAARSMAVSSMVIPYLKGGDVIQVADINQDGSFLYELMIVDEVTIPLNVADAMTVSARKLDVNIFPA